MQQRVYRTGYMLYSHLVTSNLQGAPPHLCRSGIPRRRHLRPAEVPQADHAEVEGDTTHRGSVVASAQAYNL